MYQKCKKNNFPILKVSQGGDIVLNGLYLITLEEVLASAAAAKKFLHRGRCRHDFTTGQIQHKPSPVSRTDHF